MEMRSVLRTESAGAHSINIYTIKTPFFGSIIYSSFTSTICLNVVQMTIVLPPPHACNSMCVYQTVGCCCWFFTFCFFLFWYNRWPSSDARDWNSNTSWRIAPYRPFVSAGKRGSSIMDRLSNPRVCECESIWTSELSGATRFCYLCVFGLVISRMHRCLFNIECLFVWPIRDRDGCGVLCVCVCIEGVEAGFIL